jgi:hypothetical protein
MITVACVWVTGNVAYGVEYVGKLRAMAARHLDREFNFVCLTDRPREAAAALDYFAGLGRMVSADILVIAPPAPLAGWWAKLELFNQAHWSSFGERVLYLDLDVLVVGDLAPIADYASAFALVPPGGNFKPRGFRTVRRFNSSVMSFTPGADLARLYSYAGAAVREGVGETAGRLAPLWGDQDWIGEQMPGADTMPADWFPRLSEMGALPASAMRLNSKFPQARVILCKKPKPHVAAGVYPAVAEIWR